MPIVNSVPLASEARPRLVDSSCYGVVGGLVFKSKVLDFIKVFFLGLNKIFVLCAGVLPGIVFGFKKVEDKIGFCQIVF